MPISLLKPGDVRVVTAIRGNDSTVKHLYDLGIIEGVEIRVISQLDGNLIIDVKGSRLAIEKSLTSRIFV